MSLLRSVSIATAALLAAGGALADDLNMRTGVTEISRSIYDLHMVILQVCIVIGVLVFGTMLWSMLVHRKSLGHQPATFHESTRIELLWTIIPTAILVALAIPATKTLVAMYDTGGEDMTIEVRAYQWKWHYKYLDGERREEVSFFSNLATPLDEIVGNVPKGEHYLLEVDNPLVIPTGRKVRFLLTSNDVIHAWWVPDFGLKRDAIPGFVNDIWAFADKPGIYRGQCAELCGKDHGYMPVVVRAVEQAEFDAWYAQEKRRADEIRQCVDQQWTAESLYAKGEQVYGTFCASCHQANGMGLPPAFPALKGSPVATGAKETHIDLVINGKAGTAMQAFGTQLDPCSLAAVVHYERNAFGNSSGDVTMPQDVLARPGR
jgi:cytochrome c oxidase subunit 2